MTTAGRRAGLALGAALFATSATAQNITIDGSLSPAQTLAGPSYTIGAGLGKQVGANLFQSFGRFGLVTGESATFTGPATVANIIGRVTGGSPSAIDGLIRSAIAGANLFLVNPFGIVFGPHAGLNVGGSFHASTADYLKLADGATFQATHPDGSTFSAAPPAAFGFLSVNPGAIAVNGGGLNAPGLGLVGGPVTIAGGTLTSPGGAIRIASAGGPGEVPVDPTQAPMVATFSSVAIGGGAKLKVTGGGSVFVDAGSLVIDASRIEADNTGSGAGGHVALRAVSQIMLADGASVRTVAKGTGSGAAIMVGAGALDIQNAAKIAAASSGEGAGGSISVVVGGALTIDGGDARSARTGILSTSTGAGNAGPITVAAAALSIVDNGGIASLAASSGSGGAVSVNAAGGLTLDGTSARSPTGIVTLSTGDGQAGPIAVGAGSLSILNNAVIQSDTLGSGNAGDVRVDVASTLSIDGTSANPKFLSDPKKLPFFLTGITAQALGITGNGDSGSITVSAGALAIRSNGLIASITAGRGDAGPVSVAVAGGLTIDGATTALALATGILSQTVRGSGSAGNVSITSADLSILDNGVIASGSSLFNKEARSRLQGNGGAVSIAVEGAMSIDGTAETSFTGVASGSTGSGNGGPIAITAASLSLRNNGTIVSGSLGSGNGGSIMVNIAGELVIDGALQTPLSISSLFGGPFTGISAGSVASGNAGAISIRAGAVTLVNGGDIVSGTSGSGSGGSVFVAVGGALTIRGDSENPTLLTGVTTQTYPHSSGDGGQLVVRAGSASITNNGSIESQTFGSGRGGDVSVAIEGGLTIGSGGAVSAATFAAGDGGKVAVSVGGSLAIDGAGEVSATGIVADAEPSSTGHAGTVAVIAQNVAITANGVISSSTFAAGNGGDVSVTVAGTLALDGSLGDPRFATGIFAEATPGAAGSAGGIGVTADALVIGAAASIASSTAGPGRGGDVRVAAQTATVAGPHALITAQSNGSGAAGSIALVAGGLQIRNGAAITTAAASANGGDIGLAVGGLFYLQQGAVTTSVFTRSGNGGNIAIAAPQVVMTGASRIVAQAFRGHGGDIAITAGAFVPATDSRVSAASQLGISGTVTISGEETGLNSSLVVLPGNLRSPEAILRSGCAGRGARPRSSLVEAGRGSLPQTPAAALPALYLAPHAAGPRPAAAGGLVTGLAAAPGCPEARL